MNYPPHMNLTRPDAADKWERESPQRWMKQEQEGRSFQVSSNTATQPLSPRTTRQGEIKIEAKQQIRKRPQGVPGTNVHSAYAGISVHNALLNLGPPPPDAKVGSKHLPWLRLTDWEMMNLRQRMKKNAKWRPSDEMIRKELGEIGRGPHGYAKAKEEATIRGVEFLNEDSVENQGLHRKTFLSDQPFSGPNRGMILNQAKKRKRETQVLPPEVTTLEGSVPAHAAKQQRLRASDAATNGSETMGGPKPDRAYDRIHRVSAGKANSEGVESKRKPTMVIHDLPSIEAIQPIVGHEEEGERMGVKSNDVKRVVGSGCGADLFKAGRATNSGSNVPQAVPVELGPNKSDPLIKSPLAAKPRPALTAHAITVVPIHLTDMSFTDSDASSATSSEGYEMSEPPTSLDQSPSSESSAESSLGDVSLQPPKRHSSEKPPIFYDLSFDDSSEMGTGADTGASPAGDQSVAASPAISTGNVFRKLGSRRTSSSRKRNKDHAYDLAPKDDTRAILVEPATTNTVTHGPMSSRTPLDRQAREIVFAAVTRAIELGGPSINIISDEKSLPNPTSAVVPPTTQLGNARGSAVTKAAIPLLHHPSEDEALSNLTPAGNENVYAATSTSIKPEAATLDSSTKPETNTYPVSEPVVSTQTLLRGPTSTCAYERYERLKLKQAVDKAVARSEELGEPSFGQSLLDLYEQRLRDPTIADLLVAVLMRKPFPAQSAEFSNRIEAATNKNRHSQVHRNASISSVLSSPSIPTAAPVLPVRTTSVSSNNHSPSTAESASPPNPMKPPPASVTGSSRGIAESTVVAGPKYPPVTSRNSNILSTSTATSIIPSTASSGPSSGQSSLTDKLANPPTPARPPLPSKPIVQIGVPGGSGVMVWNRAKRRARISARESGSVEKDGVGKNSNDHVNERHQRLRDFVVNGKIT